MDSQESCSPFTLLPDFVRKRTILRVCSAEEAGENGRGSARAWPERSRGHMASRRRTVGTRCARRQGLWVGAAAEGGPPRRGERRGASKRWRPHAERRDEEEGEERGPREDRLKAGLPTSPPFGQHALHPCSFLARGRVEAAEKRPITTTRTRTIGRRLLSVAHGVWLRQGLDRPDGRCMMCGQCVV